GLPDGLEDAVGGLHDPDGRALPNLNAMGASSSQKDLLVEINAMWAPAGTTYGSATAPFNATLTQMTDPTGHTHMPTPDVLNMVADTFDAHGNGIKVHFDIGPDPGSVYASSTAVPYRYVPPAYARGGELIQETKCNPALPNCQFPDYPGTVGW